MDFSVSFLTTEEGDADEPHSTVSREEWLVARRTLLAEEKAFTRLAMNSTTTLWRCHG